MNLRQELRTYIDIPYVDALVKGAGREVSTIRTEGHTVDGFCVPLECLSTGSCCHVPETHCGVETRAIGKGGK